MTRKKRHFIAIGILCKKEYLPERSFRTLDHLLILKREKESPRRVEMKAFGYASTMLCGFQPSIIYATVDDVPVWKHAHEILVHTAGCVGGNILFLAEPFGLCKNPFAEKKSILPGDVIMTECINGDLDRYRVVLFREIREWQPTRLERLLLWIQKNKLSPHHTVKRMTP